MLRPLYFPVKLHQDLRSDLNCVVGYASANPPYR
jgi:hypothetical protein